MVSSGLEAVVLVPGIVRDALARGIQTGSRFLDGSGYKVGEVLEVAALRS